MIQRKLQTFAKLGRNLKNRDQIPIVSLNEFSKKKGGGEESKQDC